MKKKLTVVTNERGTVIGTQLEHGDTPDPTGVTTVLTAGPGQTLHKIEYDIPPLDTRAHIEDFHKKLGEHLKAGKPRHRGRPGHR
jgi:hypothetical protein